jgi:spore germination protein GerM
MAVALLASTACGVPLDDQPRTITRVTEPTEVPQTTSASPTAESVTVYFLREGVLQDAQYPVDGPPELDEALGFVLASEPPAGLVSRIPTGTSLRGIATSGSLATIDLSNEINAIGGSAQKEAYAQLVFTALESPEITRVRFRVQGEPVQAPTDNANLDVVTADDYDPPLNPR